MYRPGAFLLLLIFLSGLSFDANGQSFRGGIKAGLTASEVSGDHSAGLNKLGWNASVFTDFPVSEYAYWHLELMYIMKGSREFNDPESPEDGIFRDYTFSLQYVEIPVLFKRDFPIMGRLQTTDHLSGELGLSVSRIIGHYETNDFGVDNTRVMAGERPFRAAELNAILGFSLPLWTGVAFNARYIQGITPVRDHASGKKVWYNRGQYNSAWAFGLSYTFF